MRLASLFGSFTYLALAMCLRLGAQALPPVSGKPGLAPAGAATFKVDVNLVLVEVGVHDEHGRAVGILKQSDFHVFEGGKEQVISSFSHGELPLAVALVVDNS